MIDYLGSTPLIPVDLCYIELPLNWTRSRPAQSRGEVTIGLFLSLRWSSFLSSLSSWSGFWFCSAFYSSIFIRLSLMSLPFFLAFWWSLDHFKTRCHVLMSAGGKNTKGKNTLQFGPKQPKDCEEKFRWCCDTPGILCHFLGFVRSFFPSRILQSWCDILLCIDNLRDLSTVGNVLSPPNHNSYCMNCLELLQTTEKTEVKKESGKNPEYN